MTILLVYLAGEIPESVHACLYTSANINGTHMYTQHTILGYVSIAKQFNFLMCHQCTVVWETKTYLSNYNILEVKCRDVLPEYC